MNDKNKEKQKENRKKYMREYRKKNPSYVERAKAYKKEYDQRFEIKKRNKEYKKENHFKRKNNLKVKLLKLIRNKKYLKENPEKIKAQRMADYHLKHLKKPGFEMHHPDYSQPLKVILLPIKVHQKLHQIEQRLAKKTISDGKKVLKP